MANAQSLNFPTSILAVKAAEFDRCTSRKILSQVIYILTFTLSLAWFIETDICTLYLAKVLATIGVVINTDTNDDFFYLFVHFGQINVHCFIITIF